MRGTQPFIDGSYFYRYSELAASVALNAAEAKASAVTFVRAAAAAFVRVFAAIVVAVNWAVVLMLTRLGAAG